MVHDQAECQCAGDVWSAGAGICGGSAELYAFLVLASDAGMFVCVRVGRGVVVGDVVLMLIDGDVQPTFKKTFNVSNISTLPAVEIIYAHESYNPKLIADAIADGAKGIVIAGTGAGEYLTLLSPPLPLPFPSHPLPLPPPPFRHPHPTQNSF